MMQLNPKVEKPMSNSALFDGYSFHIHKKAKIYEYSLSYS